MNGRTNERLVVHTHGHTDNQPTNPPSSPLPSPPAPLTLCSSTLVRLRFLLCLGAHLLMEAVMSSFLADASLVAEVPPGPSSMVKAMGDCFLASAFTSSPPPPSWEGVVALVEEVECELDLEKGGEVDELVVVGVEPGCSGPCGLASAGASLLSFLSVSAGRAREGQGCVEEGRWHVNA